VELQSLAAGVGLSATTYWITVLSTAGGSTLVTNGSTGTNCWDTGSTTYSALPATFPASMLRGEPRELEGHELTRAGGASRLRAASRK